MGAPGHKGSKGDKGDAVSGGPQRGSWSLGRAKRGIERMGRGVGHGVSCLLEPHLDIRK